LGNDYTHAAIDHAVTYVDGQVHTNGLENFLKPLDAVDQRHLRLG
jgi:hypothetical protein